MNNPLNFHLLHLAMTALPHTSLQWQCERNAALLSSDGLTGTVVCHRADAAVDKLPNELVLLTLFRESLPMNLPDKSFRIHLA